jgi:hypothetical protein
VNRYGGFGNGSNKGIPNSSSVQTFKYTFTSSVTNPLAQLQILGAVGKAGDAYNMYFSDFKLVKN